MRICFISSGNLEEDILSGVAADVYCFAFPALGEVFYERELSGEEGKLERLARLSAKLKAVVAAGCYTDVRGVKRKSVAVAEGGRLLGAADANHCIDGKKYRPGADLKIFPTRAGKIGVAVGEDVLFPEVVKSLSLCGSDVLLNVYERLGDNVEQTVMRAEAFLYGVNICMCAHGYAQGADIGGMLAFATRTSPFVYELQTGREYHVTESRQRGFCRRARGER